MTPTQPMAYGFRVLTDDGRQFSGECRAYGIAAVLAIARAQAREAGIGLAKRCSVVVRRTGAAP